MFIKIMRSLIKLEIKIVNIFLNNKDSVWYEDFIYSIKHHSEDIERIYNELHD